jgi:hypothetical protein
VSPSPHPSLEHAADFLWGNARLLERVLFAHQFRGGPAEAVAAAVRAYRNSDGGFGHAAEPDVRAPDSMPVHTEIALRALSAAGVRDGEMALGACEFLASVAEPSGRVPIVLPAALEYPHASHWDHPIFTGDSINPAGALAGLLHEQSVAHPWLELATQWCWAQLAEPMEDAHEIVSTFTFLELVPDRRRALTCVDRVAANLDKAGFFLREPGTNRYGVTPLDLCPTPDAIGRPAFPDGLLDSHLDDLASRQQEDGGWPITFTPPSAGAVQEWRGRWTLSALSTLRAYGRI